METKNKQNQKVNNIILHPIIKKRRSEAIANILINENKKIIRFTGRK